jgi:hypothetical protein
MRMLGVIAATISLALTACDRPAAPIAAPSAPEVDRAALLGALKLSANEQGQVRNECGDWVTPAIATAELGGAAGAAQLVAIGGGPSMAACYGDGPDLHLLLRDGATYREIYSARGRMLVILPGTTNGVRDIADGGPGFSFPLWQWNGTVYANTNRQVSDAEIANATFLP